MTYSAQFLENTFDYKAYRNLIEELILQNKTTGLDHSEAMVNYTKMNVQRMKRLDKTVILNENISKTLLQLKQNYTWLVVTEAWCGDAAQIIPVLDKIGEISQGKISVRYIFNF